MHATNGSDSASAFLSTTTGDTSIDADLKYIQQLDWSGSSIGSISSWPSGLLVLINLAMLSPQPQLFLLGTDSIILYNTAYGKLLGDHHPEYQGRPIALDTALIANAKNIDRIVDRASTKAKPANENWVPFFFLKGGKLEEVFLSATMVKLPLSLGGYHATTYDTTSEAVRSRREATYDSIFSPSSLAAIELKSLWKSLADGVSVSDDEIPFALFYSAHSDIIHDTITDAVRRKVDSRVLSLESAIGTFKTPVPTKLELNDSRAWIGAIQRAIVSRAPVLITSEDGTFPEWARGASVNRCYGDECKSAVVLPSALDNDEDVFGIWIIGIAPRRPYDEQYQAWMRTCHRTFGNLVASIAIAEARTLAKESEARRTAKERDILKKELLLKKREAALATGKVQRMLSIMESACVGIFECLPTGEVIQANDSFCDLSGCPKDFESNLPVNIFDHCYANDLETLSSYWGSLLAAQPITVTIRFRAEHESTLWVQVACVPVMDEHGIVVNIAGCITDVSAQKRVEQEAIKRAETLERLRLSEARLLKFVETAPLGIMILDSNKRPTFVNRTWLQLTQHPDVPLSQIDMQLVVLPQDLHVLDENLNLLSSSYKQVEFQLRLKHTWNPSADGSSEHAWVQITAFPDVIEGSIQQIMVAMTDINHFKFAELIQRARLEEAVEAKRQQENFVDMTSHEIRNPLSAVIHCTDAICQSMTEMRSLMERVRTSEESAEEYSANTLRLYDLHQDIAESVDTIIACNIHQKRITDDILSLSKLDSNLLEICPSVFGIDSLLRQIHSTFTAETRRSGVKLNTDRDPSLKNLDMEWVKADPGRIMQILVNLVANAIKFTKDTTSSRIVTIAIGVSTRRPTDIFSNFIMAGEPKSKRSRTTKANDEDFYLWFCVRDTGCGMNEAGRSRIFSRFSQASPKTYNKYGGSGLGLFISHKLASLQGGEIGFSSEENQGSTFAFYVQASRAIPPKKDVKSDSSKTLSRASQQQNSDVKPSILSILLVEDNFINQKVLKKQLIRYGFTVFTADHGQAAYDFLQTTSHWVDGKNHEDDSRPSIDVILMDIEMPVMNGMQCATKIRTAQREGHLDKHIPIIAVTANARPEQLRGTIEVGMDDAISKPFRVRDLVPVIERLGLPVGHLEQDAAMVLD